MSLQKGLSFLILKLPAINRETADISQFNGKGITSSDPRISDHRFKE